MSTDTLVGGDLDVDTFVRALADEPDVICEECDEDGTRCTEVARWALRCPRCGGTDVFCDRHRLEIDVWVSHHYAGLVHSRCRNRHEPPLAWRPL